MDAKQTNKPTPPDIARIKRNGLILDIVFGIVSMAIGGCLLYMTFWGWRKEPELASGLIILLTFVFGVVCLLGGISALTFGFWRRFLVDMAKEQEKKI